MFNRSLKHRLTKIERRLTGIQQLARQRIESIQSDFSKVRADLDRLAAEIPEASAADLNELDGLAGQIHAALQNFDAEATATLGTLAADNEQLEEEVATARKWLSLIDKMRHLIAECNELGVSA